MKAIKHFQRLKTNFHFLCTLLKVNHNCGSQSKEPQRLSRTPLNPSEARLILRWPGSQQMLNNACWPVTDYGGPHRARICWQPALRAAPWPVASEFSPSNDCCHLSPSCPHPPHTHSWGHCPWPPEPGPGQQRAARHGRGRGSARATVLRSPTQVTTGTSQAVLSDVRP